MDIPGKQSLKDFIYDFLKSRLSAKDFVYFIAFQRSILKHFRCMVERDSSTQEFACRFVRYSVLEGDTRIQDRISSLEAGTDDKSVRTLRRMFSMYKFIHQNNLIPAELWFGSFGKKEEAEIEKSMLSISKSVRIPKNMPIRALPAIFHFNSGLRFVPQEVKERCINGRDILDCGAYVGDTAIMFSNLYNARKIFSFEPVSSNYARLLANIRLCDLRNVVPVKKGVGETASKKMITHMESGSYIDGSKADVEEIEVIDIDSFVRENKAKPGVIKMDIEGFELKAVRGALKTIKRFRPILLIAVYHTPEDFFEIKPLLEKQVDGYTFLFRQMIAYNPVGETFLIGYPSS